MKKTVPLLITSLAVILIAIVSLVWVQSKRVSDTKSEVALPTPAQRTVVKVEGVDAIDDLTDMVYDPAREVFYVSSFDEGIVYIVSAKSKRIEGQIKMDFPHKLYFDEVSDVLYVSAGDNRLIKIDVGTFTEISRVYVSRKPSGMALDRSRGYLYVATEFGNTVDIINTETINAPTSPLNKLIIICSISSPKSLHISFFLIYHK